MKKSNLIAFIDIAAFISFIFVVSTGVLMRYLLPPQSGHSMEILGMSRHGWGDIHFYFTFMFLAILSIHLIFHWRFLYSVLHGRNKKVGSSRFILGLVGLLAVLALAIAPFIAPIEDSGTKKRYQTGKGKNDAMHLLQ